MSKSTCDGVRGFGKERTINVLGVVAVGGPSVPLKNRVLIVLSSAVPEYHVPRLKNSNTL